ncbi:MAG: hypothetical protein NC037_05105 [Bacteroides sp.]|nr:hypothetical protein [Bacillota bacterium]MCM1394103.1 hypothetical protein [[Eubacterium] siraeum]MCM1455884.1 hypothetical protein [Bacteroides sp.]
MDKFNIVFIETENAKRSILGRRAEEYILREFAVFDAAGSRIVKEEVYLSSPEKYFLPDAINVALTLDTPLLRRKTVEHFIALMRHKNIKSVRLGARDSMSFIRIGDAADEGIFVSDDDFLKLGDAKSYNMVYNLLKDRILDAHLLAGVNIVDKTTVFIDDTVKIESGAQILPFSRIEGDSVIKRDAKVGASYVRNSVVESGACVEMSHIADSCVRARATVGPFARLRGAQIGEGCRIGDFVEVKASRLAGGVKASHLSYVGDAEVGEGTNVGCGTVFCNYDGKEKHKTTVGSKCFLGANTNLIAPVVVGDNAFIAAGTTVTRDVCDSSFTIGRVRQDTKTKTKLQD